ncbi:secA translation cis-regulator SecM [Erwinia tracheiphila]|uniref:Secretion monitor n=1 Tax=Erwinia tracheiphila TaxID=65700 RepID=A0A345CUX5_9GAMM|nr:secA translation cis-regulator SecM [Erwinia tracheiphila]AXF77242.1 secA regulator SecM [Erwinia tracheiphila]UIA84066.1 secA translation cis-regulator SecM [Erwinia tracheiphila]UIA92648.1 secA translation cis-regulator SecM [Erwinia tracheiphila]
MSGILNRWRQFGRRYFWPHLLLGMVTASFGLPHAVNGDTAALSERPARSLNISSGVNVDRLALRQENVRWPNLNIDYWHQHAIRTVIRHLSFTFTPARLSATKQSLPLGAHKQILLDTLNSLLTHEIKRSANVHSTRQYRLTPRPTWQIGLWVARVEGIRAGPTSLI